MNAPGYGLTDRATDPIDVAVQRAWERTKHIRVTGHTCIASINSARVMINGQRYRFIRKTHSRHVAAPLRDAREPAGKLANDLPAGKN